MPSPSPIPGVNPPPKTAHAKVKSKKASRVGLPGLIDDESEGSDNGAPSEASSTSSGSDGEGAYVPPGEGDERLPKKPRISSPRVKETRRDRHSPVLSKTSVEPDSKRKPSLAKVERKPSSSALPPARQHVLNQLIGLVKRIFGPGMKDSAAERFAREVEAALFARCNHVVGTEYK